MKNRWLMNKKDQDEASMLAFSNTKWLLILFQLLALVLVYIYNIKELNTRAILFGIGLLFASFSSITLLRFVTRGEPYFLLIANMIFTIGVLMIYRIDPALGERQLMIYLGSLAAFFAVYFFLRRTYSFWEGRTVFYYALTVGLFLITLVFGLTLGGARNWISIAGIQIQPSEFAKIPFAFFVASWFMNYEKYTAKPWGIYSLSVAVYFLMGLFVLQRELGTAAVFFAVLIATQVAFEKRRYLIVINIIMAVVGLFVAYHLFGHVRVRFDMWLNPWQDFNDKGYQIIQALFAIAAGGFFGTGIGLGHPERIPLGYSDFIFASVIEEMGMFMGICLVLLFILLLYRGIKVAMQQERDFYAALAVAISVIFAVQALIMFGGTLKVIPLTGITVPFLTYGGSSLLSSFILLAALQICSEHLILKRGGDETK